MAATPTKTNPVQLGTSATDIYTVPAGKTAIVKELILFNSHTASLNTDIHMVPSGGSASATNQIFDQDLVTKQTYILGMNTVLGAGDKVQGLCGTASKVAARISVIEF